MFPNNILGGMGCIMNYINLLIYNIDIIGENLYRFKYIQEKNKTT